METPNYTLYLLLELVGLGLLIFLWVKLSAWRKALTERRILFRTQIREAQTQLKLTQHRLDQVDPLFDSVLNPDMWKRRLAMLLVGVLINWRSGKKRQTA
jgi:hypothetical protein